VFGEENRCPHCRAIAGVDVSAGLGRCRVCGGPRIALPDASIARSGRETAQLAQAQAAALGITVSRFGGYAAYAVALLTALFAGMLGLVTRGPVAAIIVLILAAAFAFGGALLTQRARRARKQQTQALDQARQIVASDVLAQRPNLESAELGRLLGLSTEQAELLLAELNVNNLLSSGGANERRERLAVDPLAAELGEIPVIEPTQEAPPVRATEVVPPLAGSGRRR
jgi:hypothetical protein